MLHLNIDFTVATAAQFHETTLETRVVEARKYEEHTEELCELFDGRSIIETETD